MVEATTVDRFTSPPPFEGSPVLSPQTESLTHEGLKVILGQDYRDQIRSRLVVLGFIHPEVDLPFFERTDRHEGSSAHYLLDIYIGKVLSGGGQLDRLLVSYIPPHSATSTHYHASEPEIPGIVEEYYGVRGKLNLQAQELRLIGQGKEPNKQEIPWEGLVVLPQIAHRAETGEQGALTIILMRNAGLVDKDKQHIRVDSL